MLPKLVGSKTDNCIQAVTETYPFTTTKFSKITGEPTGLLKISETVNQKQESIEKTNSLLVRMAKN